MERECTVIWTHYEIKVIASVLHTVHKARDLHFWKGFCLSSLTIGPLPWPGMHVFLLLGLIIIERCCGTGQYSYHQGETSGSVALGSVNLSEVLQEQTVPD